MGNGNPLLVLNRLDLEGHAALRKAGIGPIALDESVEEVADARRAIELGAADLLSLKWTRFVGIIPMFELQKICCERSNLCLQKRHFNLQKT